MIYTNCLAYHILKVLSFLSAIFAEYCCLELGQRQTWQATLHLAREYEWTALLLPALAVRQAT